MTEQIKNSEWTTVVPQDNKYHCVRKIGEKGFSCMSLCFFSKSGKSWFLCDEHIESLQGYEFSIQSVYVPGI